jgi:hypothetical protein
VSLETLAKRPPQRVLLDVLPRTLEVGIASDHVVVEAPLPDRMVSLTRGPGFESSDNRGQRVSSRTEEDDRVNVIGHHNARIELSVVVARNRP